MPVMPWSTRKLPVNDWKFPNVPLLSKRFSSLFLSQLLIEWYFFGTCGLKLNQQSET
jgi:hypothetical protein